jgi:hypothetical protein
MLVVEKNINRMVIIKSKREEAASENIIPSSYIEIPNGANKIFPLFIKIPFMIKSINVNTIP